MEAFVTEQALLRFESPAVARALAPYDNEERMSEVVQTIAELQTRRTALAAEYAAGEHDKADYRVMMDTMKGKLTQAENEQQLVSDKARKLAVRLDGGIRQVWDTASIQWRASVLKLIICLPSNGHAPKWPDDNGWKFAPDRVILIGFFSLIHQER